MGIQAEELQQVSAERDGFERLSLEAMRMLDEHGLLPEFRRRMDTLDKRQKAAV